MMYKNIIVKSLALIIQGLAFSVTVNAANFYANPTEANLRSGAGTYDKLIMPGSECVATYDEAANNQCGGATIQINTGFFTYSTPTRNDPYCTTISDGTTTHNITMGILNGCVIQNLCENATDSQTLFPPDLETNTFSIPVGGANCEYVVQGGVSFCTLSGCIVTVKGTGNEALAGATDGGQYLPPDPPPYVETTTDETTTNTTLQPQETICVPDGQGGETCTYIDTKIIIKDTGNTKDYNNDGTKAELTDVENPTVTTTETQTEVVNPDGSKTITKTVTINYDTGGSTTYTYDYTTGGPTTSTGTNGQQTQTETTQTDSYDSQGQLTGSEETTNEPEPVPDLPPGTDDLVNVDDTAITSFIDGISAPYDTASIAKPSFSLSLGALGTCSNSDYSFTVFGTLFEPDFCTYITILQSIMYWLFAVVTGIYMFTTITKLPRL